jgi:hypothetical protein
MPARYWFVEGDAALLQHPATGTIAPRRHHHAGADVENLQDAAAGAEGAMRPAAFRDRFP